jgi:hypothetical protein
MSPLGLPWVLLTLTITPITHPYEHITKRSTFGKMALKMSSVPFYSLFVWMKKIGR